MDGFEGNVGAFLEMREDSALPSIVTTDIYVSLAHKL